MDGVPFRRLAFEYGISTATAFRHAEAEMDLLPENTYLSAHYCDFRHGILHLDGKYVKVKGYPKKIPFLYALDYLTHDIPVGMLVPSESTIAFAQIFRRLRQVGYPLKVVIVDDVLAALEPVVARFYPEAKIQLCHTHYLETIRQNLSVRTSLTYQPFFYALQNALSPKHHRLRQEALLASLTYHYRRDERVLSVMAGIEQYKEKLFAYKDPRFKQCPYTNNFIESYNSHLNGRLKTLKGFQSFHSAERFLNAWMIRRRTKPFTDCELPFKHLNGMSSLEQTLKKDLPWPCILGIPAPQVKHHK